MESWIWLGIAFCLSQSGIFSGLNLALLGLSRLQLEVEAKAGDEDAIRILHLRRDSHFLLTTILWGNVSVNCLLTLLSDSVLYGVGFVIRIYQKLLYPVAKPTALLLDRWLGQEEVSYFRERELREVIRRHMLSDDADLDHREGLGALNFLVLDDLPIREEGGPRRAQLPRAGRSAHSRGGPAGGRGQRARAARRPRPTGLPGVPPQRGRPVPAEGPG
jgi:CBS domain containing-hemolysin-like protein